MSGSMAGGDSDHEGATAARQGNKSVPRPQELLDVRVTGNGGGGCKRSSWIPGQSGTSGITAVLSTGAGAAPWGMMGEGFNLMLGATTKGGETL